ncbi:hypothetical protein SAMN06298211_101507 [Prevotellaceae bacterium MN60]|nr:hypothetical protein SAMN06298211_101507 [Prevotellaceae bacterium MN60]
MEVMKEDKQRVELLLKKFKPRILRLAVNFISFDSNASELQNYLREHKDFHPDQRELFHTLLQLEGPEVKELVILSVNIATKEYNLDEIIPLD